VLIIINLLIKIGVFSYVYCEHSVADVVGAGVSVWHAAAASASMVSKSVDVRLGLASGVSVASLPEDAESAGEEVSPLAGDLLSVVVPAVVVDAVDNVNEGAQAESVVGGGVAVGGAAGGGLV
jgi:hypothetical protein